MTTSGAPAEPTNATLREKLRLLLSQPTDVVVTHIEVNDKHGVGVLTLALFGPGADVISVRSQDHFGGQQGFGREHMRLAHGGSRSAAYANVLAAFRRVRLGRVLCAPYYPDDVLSAIALKDAFDVPLCTYLMDDQNVFSHGIPDGLMRELLAKSDLRLAISPQLRTAYERKYGGRFWFLPPTVPGKLVQASPVVPALEGLRARNGVVLGNVWSKQWLTLLASTVRESGIQVDWYCSSGHAHGVSVDQLASDGIHMRGRVDDETLVATLRERPFVIVPSGILDGSDDRAFIAQLSLPSRIVYVLATSNTPIVVLGHEQTAAARFVARCGIGFSIPYDGASLRRAVESLADPAAQWRLRHAAAQMADGFRADGVAEWIWRSLDARAPVDDRFERIITNSASTA